MISAVFFGDLQGLSGFRVSGHAGAGEFGHDLVCAAVTSAVMMTANTLTEILHEPAKVSVLENEVMLTGCGSDASHTVLAGLLLHLRALERDHPKNLRVQLPTDNCVLS